MPDKWWDRDARDLTVLEFIHAPSSFAKYKQIKYNIPPPYTYFDTPDGQDIWKKMWVSIKWGGSAGILFGVIDNRLYSNPKTVFQAVNRFAWFVVPMTSMFVTFTAITYASTNLRGKDGPLNHAIGGAVAGSLAGVWFKNGGLGVMSALLIGIFGACRKHSHDIGNEFMDILKISQVYGDHETPYRDYSLTQLGERGWTTGKN